jgi:hypothetical protein
MYNKSPPTVTQILDSSLYHHNLECSCKIKHGKGRVPEHITITDRQVSYVCLQYYPQGTSECKSVAEQEGCQHNIQ